ncbi:hypothetical protein EJA70_18965 [Pseudomonas sp. PB103]|jgi:hypothetical protein|uniref:hypothetical protein n=1 Tax=Pseudomonas sp. PB103 TaxID=2494698 RepID=UPI00131B9CB8|nr:hypothetical protein [Pseudomonas sp. PB103]KAE9642329.1 hypothetical protein EJA70_18965 [Pseudomonas sp. PB103]
MLDSLLTINNFQNATRSLSSHLFNEINRVRDSEMASAGFTCYARLTLDLKGKPGFDGLSVSALPWALGRLIKPLCAVDFKDRVRTLKRGLADDWSQSQGNLFGV